MEMLFQSGGAGLGSHVLSLCRISAENTVDFPWSLIAGVAEILGVFWREWPFSDSRVNEAVSTVSDCFVWGDTRNLGKRPSGMERDIESWISPFKFKP
jgi:hypothetical protein